MRKEFKDWLAKNPAFKEKYELSSAIKNKDRKSVIIWFWKLYKKQIACGIPHNVVVTYVNIIRVERGISVKVFDDWKEVVQEYEGKIEETLEIF